MVDEKDGGYSAKTKIATADELFGRRRLGA